jgi:ribosomal protein S18 acetylase RimI-like enzyme
MFLRKVRIEDLDWVYETLSELRGDVEYPLDDFKKYFTNYLNNDFCSILIYENETEKVGLVTLNKFFIPRYLGVGYEMEEFVIHKSHRGKGYSYKMIDAVKKFVTKDSMARKLVIRSDGEDSKHIYAKALIANDLKSFQVYLNKL